ncbi:MATE family efflux transporter [Agathobaculum butyriciproducens]|uniref:MATE family efflux transporter n=1 Tax=Agathobaculum hominis TaxID=2763014 RepID=A0ABR7GPT1_9FIRM|nr:MATE family efflux transporter [Agathobaculum hominis]MBC5696315.1 MATE family efflux transporter [Agathobaculum hominis]MCO7160910.1 MATE family efflux transporter [Agathobaculum butyriciproducens]
MIKEKTFYKSFMILALSLALQNLLTYGVNMMDTLMLGRYSQNAMGGVSLCNQIQFLLQMLVVGAGEGAVVMGSQYWGRKKLEPIPHIIGVALRFGGALAVLLFILVFGWPNQILSLLSNDPAVIAEGAKYFSIIRYTYVIFTITNILVASLRSIGVVRIGYMISGSTLVINVCLNYLLIYGNLGFPEMGVRGAACATLIARCVELIIVIWFLKYRENVLNLNLRKLLHIDTSYVHDYMKVSLPVLINQALWGVAQMVQTGILGHLGGDVTAANAISVQVYQVLSVVCYGAASAAGIVVGRTIGEDNEKKLHPLVTTLQVLFISIGLCSGLAIFLLRGPILAAFGGTLTENAYRLSRQFMLVLAITTVGTSYQMACDNGIIRGGGDTAFSAKMNLVSMWCIIVPFSAMAAFWWKCPPVAVFFLLKWDQLYKAIPVGIRLHSWKWVKKVTRV